MISFSRILEAPDTYSRFFLLLHICKTSRDESLQETHKALQIFIIYLRLSNAFQIECVARRKFFLCEFLQMFFFLILR